MPKDPDKTTITISKALALILVQHKQDIGETYEDVIKYFISFKTKLHRRCRHCKYYLFKDDTSFICYKSTDIALCEFFKVKNDGGGEADGADNLE